MADEEQIRTVIKYFAQPQVAWIELSGKILSAEKEMQYFIRNVIF